MGILLTHYHADYIAGHTAFNLPILMGPKSSRDSATLHIEEKGDGETLKLGTIQIKIIHTPGHTLESSCFLAIDS